jgi:hypothetical protein
VVSHIERVDATEELGGAWKIGGEAARATMPIKLEAYLSIKRSVQMQGYDGVYIYYVV